MVVAWSATVCGIEGSVRLREGVTVLPGGPGRRRARAVCPDTDLAFSGEAMGITRRFVEYHLDRKLSRWRCME